MEIYIDTNNVLDDASGVYLMETSDKEPLAPRGVLVQRLNESATRLVSLLSRFTTVDLRRSADDELKQSAALIFDLALSARKASGKAQAITDQIHSFLVNLTLCKVYINKGLADLSKAHETLATADAENLNLLLHTKIPPI